MITMIIGTGFVVTKAVLDYAIVGGGNPARIIRYRKAVNK